MLNQSLDDMDFIMPLGGTGGRIPVTALAKAMQKSATTFNNINVANSNVGIINTGDLAKIDAAITLTQGTDVAALGHIVNELVDAVVLSKELDQQSKKEIVEALQEVSQQIVGERKKSVILALVKFIEERAAGANSIIQMTQAIWSTIKEWN